ncbi:MAG TPA: cob(I)yrinic acid a,c-diamide adenosyltransferase, partial [Candidatus Eisenbacteria bacterium]|nr:cob(I)yrinic acid a,c-diamide adenosyltransferase [Candidatus Eisenbacteria bacterium]
MDVVRIYTKTGDAGETSLFGGDRVAKDDPRLEAYGSLDELNAFLGWFRSTTLESDLATIVLGIQPVLFDLGAHLATPRTADKARRILPAFDTARVTELEAAIDTLETELPPLTSFILPGGSAESALLQVTRAISRRAERRVVRALEESGVELPEGGLAYLNRLSDLLF